MVVELVARVRLALRGGLEVFLLFFFFDYNVRLSTFILTFFGPTLVFSVSVGQWN